MSLKKLYQLQICEWTNLDGALPEAIGQNLEGATDVFSRVAGQSEVGDFVDDLQKSFIFWEEKVEGFGENEGLELVEQVLSRKIREKNAETLHDERIDDKL